MEEGVLSEAEIEPEPELEPERREDGMGGTFAW